MKSSLLLIFIFSIATIAQTFNSSELVKSDSGLVAFYPFNGNANDESGNNYNGTVSGATLTTDRFNQSDRAYNFIYNGFSSDKIEVSGTSGLNFSSGGFSISAWIKFSGPGVVGNNYPIFSKHICGEQGGYILMLYNDKLTFWLAGSGGYNVLSTSDNYTDNNWHQVIAVYDDVNQYIYVDGVLKNSVPFVYSVYNSANWALGGYNGCNGGFNGKVDEIEVFNRGLTESEIQEKYNQSANNLVAFYPFNGNAFDETGNGHDGTVNGGVLTNDRFNQSNSAYTFQIPHSNIILDGTTSLNFENGFTLNAWVKYKNINSTIVGKHNCWVVNGFLLSIDNNQIRFLVGNSVWSEVRTNEVYVEDRWYMVSGVYDQSTGTGKVYIDGELKASGTVLYNNFSSAPITISEPSNGCPENNMPGTIDEVKIYNKALSDAEILSEYLLSRNDLGLFLPFNDNANDESGNGNQCTVSGASLTQDRFGVDGKAFSFDGTDDFISIADNHNLFSDSLTISWWYKLTETPGGAWVVIGWVDGGHRYQQFFSGGQLSYLNGYNVGQPGMYFNPIYGLNDLNVWKNVVVTYQKTGASTSTTSIYVDGELKQTDNHTLAMDYVPGIDLSIGKNHNGNFFKGFLDDFRIFNRTLNSTEILALFQDSTTYNPPLEDGLVAYWPLNGNTQDSTYNNNDGINYNGVFSKDRYGNDNGSMLHNGVDSYVEGINPGNNLPAGNSPRTFSAWIKGNNYNTTYGSNIFHYGDNNSSGPLAMHLATFYNLAFGNQYGFGGIVYGNSNIIDSTWHYISAVYENTDQSIKLFVDGMLDGSGILTISPNTQLNLNWRIGYYMGNVGTSFDGNIDELKIYNIALSDQQVWDMYKATTTAPTLLFPGNDSTLINPWPTVILDWDSTVTATSYRLLIANDSLFNTILHDTTLNTSSFDFYDWFSVNIDNLYWKVRTINDGGTGPWSETNRFNIMLTDVEDETQLPTEFALLQNYPNPFNPTTTIKYHLPKTAVVVLKVYDVLGNEIATLVDEEKSAGIYNVQFAMNNFSSGIYFYQLKAGEFIKTNKMILMR